MAMQIGGCAAVQGSRKVTIFYNYFVGPEAQPATSNNGNATVTANPTKLSIKLSIRK